MSEQVIVITSDNFEKEVTQSPIPVLVDFWATWCGPCKMLTPVIEEMASDLTGKMKVAKVNVDENQSLAAQFQVMSIPTLIVFDQGQPVQRLMGYQPKEALLDSLGKYGK